MDSPSWDFEFPAREEFFDSAAVPEMALVLADMTLPACGRVCAGYLLVYPKRNFGGEALMRGAVENRPSCTCAVKRADATEVLNR